MNVVLLHGLYMNKLVMLPLQKRFERAGFKVTKFSYRTVKFNKEEVLESLDKLLDGLSGDIILVGHSMGGLVARLYQHHYNSKRVKKIITLGTPHNGSVIAKLIVNTKIKKVLGSCGDSGILKKIPEWKNCCDLGCIIGISEVGFGINDVFSKFHSKKGFNDGVVFIDEARLKNATAEVMVRVNHTQLIYSEEVFNHCLYFIENSCFNYFPKS